ncbi:MAG: quinone-dependent dihydroorotate dehydrogenase [Myxococcaceae bacterium]
MNPYALLRPLLFRFDAESAHHAGIFALSLFDGAPELARLWRRRARADRPSLSVELAGLKFGNCLGLAAGLDKNAEAVRGLFGVGFGFVEVGTVTPRPQPGNEKPRLFRLPEHQAVINRMGFNNEGAAAMEGRLRELDWRPGPLGVNLGKNKDTPLERAHDDYAIAAERLAPFADYLVVNLSSPNTPGLRKLQEPEALARTLSAAKQHAHGKPVFLKIAPDLTDEAVDAAVDVALSEQAAGLIATNTTLARPEFHRLNGEAGGLSGAPLLTRSNQVVARAWKRAGVRLPIIGVGGVFSGADAIAKIRAGASLVQIYTGFIYGGPGRVSRMLDEMEALVASAGAKNVLELRGSS